MKIIKLSHKLSQKLLITPQFKQALRILQLPLVDLRTYLKQEIAENPLLQPLEEEGLKARIEKFLHSDTAYQRSDRLKYVDTDEQVSAPESQGDDSCALPDYLGHQLRIAFLNNEELAVAEEIIANLDENGYLRKSLESLSSNLGYPIDKIRHVLEVIQTLEPSGVGARNLQECLLIQLKDKEQENSLAYKIVQFYFKELTRKKYDLIARKLKVSLEDIKKAVENITALNPKPGAVFSHDKNAPIIADIIVRIDKNKLKIAVNEKELPQLTINNQYKRLLKDPHTSEETKQFIRNRLKKALWLIEATEQRRQNVLKVVKEIFKVQKHTLTTGLSNLRPLTLKDIAQKTRLHLSTVARAVSYKYVLTPQGTIRLKDLFSPKYTSTTGTFYSARNILSKIQTAIHQEPRRRPLTDRGITKLLTQKGIHICRRTVTKYRNRLKIPASFFR